MTKQFTAVAVVLIGLSCSAAEGTCQGEITISFVSDTTWNSFEMNPDGSLGASLGPAQFVCAGPGAPPNCPPGATVYGTWPGWGADLSAIPGAFWIWRPGVTGATSPADLQGAYFSKEFDLPGLPGTGAIFLAVDDFAEVSINGTVVGSTGSITDYGLAVGAQGALKQFDLTPFMVTGPNTLTIRAQNGPGSFGGCDPCSYAGNPARVLFGGTIGFTAPTPTQPETWRRLKTRYK